MTKPIAFMVVAALALPARQAAASLITFDFESTPATYSGVGARPGALTSLTLSNGGLTTTITRPGSAFDIVANTGSQAGKPAAFGNRSLDPFFAEASSTPFVENFSPAITSVRMDFGDYGQDANDVLTIKAYSGPNGTGSLLATGSALFAAGAFPGFNTLMMGGFGAARSIVFIGGTPAFPNSVFYDNFTVNASLVQTPEPASLMLLGTGIAAVLARRRKSRNDAR